MFRRKKDRTREILTVLIAVLILTLIVNIYLTWSLSSMMRLTREPTTWEPGYVTLPSIENYTEMEVSTTPPNSILLTAGCKQLPMLTAESQIHSIQNGLEGKVGFRPNTHDVMSDALENFGIDIIMARIDTLKDGTYYAKLVLGQADSVLIIDTRPSDAIAIAVRFEAPIYLKNDLLEDYGEDIC